MITIDKDHKGCYASNGPNGKKFYFEQGNEIQRKEAMQKAVIDKIDCHKQEAILKREQKMIKIKNEQIKRENKIKEEVAKINSKKDSSPDKKDKPDNSNKQKNK